METAIYKPRRESSPKANSSHTLILHFQLPNLWENPCQLKSRGLRCFALAAWAETHIEAPECREVCPYPGWLQISASTPLWFYSFFASALSYYLSPPIRSLPLAQQPPLPHLNLTRFLVLNCPVRSEKESLFEVCIKREFIRSKWVWIPLPEEHMCFNAETLSWGLFRCPEATVFLLWSPCNILVKLRLPNVGLRKNAASQ